MQRKNSFSNFVNNGGAGLSVNLLRLIYSDLLGGLTFLQFEAEHGHHLLQVFPDFALRVRVAQQIGRMIGRQQLSSTKFQPLSSKLRYTAVSLQQSLDHNASQADNHFR